MAANEGQGEQAPRGPPGWRVEERRRTNENYTWKIDWFYYEPGTDKQYRSRKKAWARYEETKPENPEVMVEGTSAGGRTKPRKPNTKKLARMKIRTASFDVDNPPESVTWVLTDVENDEWAPYIGDEMVTKDDQKLWADTFEFAMLWKDWPGIEGNNDEENDNMASQSENPQ